MDFTSIFTKKEIWDYVLILSYDLSPISFFETEILSKMSVNNNVTIVIDESNYRRLVTDQNNRPRFWGVFYNVEKVVVANGGVFHPKFYLFVSEDKIRICTSSANLTRSAFKQNLESMVVSDFEKNKATDDEIDFFQQVISFLTSTFISENPLLPVVSIGIKNAVTNILSSPLVASTVSRKLSASFTRKTHFLSSNAKGLFAQINGILGGKYKEVHALSPFYDDDADSFKVVKGCSDKLFVYIPKRWSSFPKEVIEMDGYLKKGVSFFSAVKPDKKERFIHAKAYRFIDRKRVSYDFVTSANFTAYGLFEEEYPRNVEIGILYPSTDKEFLSSSGITFTPISSFITIETDEAVNDAAAKEAPIHFILESAFYEDGTIRLWLSKNTDAQEALKHWQCEVIIDQRVEGRYKIDQDSEGLFFHLSLEVDSDKQIEVKVVSVAGEVICAPIFVNRARHTPNLLPALGSSAFAECLKLGGISGIERAFELAMLSGKKDWLLYLLSHWNLEKIIRGLHPDSDPNDEIEDNEVPSLPNPTQKNQQMCNNLHHVLPIFEMHQNLQSFIEGLHDSYSTSGELAGWYVSYCFPIFNSIADHFGQILQREENKKRRRPTIRYPEYTWLHNYREYERYLKIMVDGLSFVKLLPIRDQKASESFQKECRLWLTNNTEPTIKEFSIVDKRLQQLFAHSAD